MTNIYMNNSYGWNSDGFHFFTIINSTAVDILIMNVH